MKKFYYSLSMFILFFYFSLSLAGQQKNSLTIGLNTSYFKDWKKLAFNIFNPEVSCSRLLSDKQSFTYTLNVFYGENLSKENMKEDAVIYRIIFSNDFTFNYLINDFFVSAGPTIRYRNEKKILYFYPQPNPFEFVIEPKKSHLDIGAAIKTGYNLNITKKTFLTLKLSYRLYNKGVNPVSLGVSYGLSW